MHFLSFLIVLFSLAEATLPARALSVPALTLDVRSTDAAGAFILVRKGKGHGDGDERFERHRRHHPHGTSRHRTFNGYQGVGNHPGFGGGNRNQSDGQN
jgi:hypothetical protein